MKIVIFALLIVGAAIVFVSGVLWVYNNDEESSYSYKGIGRKRQKLIESRIHQAFKDATYLSMDGDCNREVVINIEDLSLQEKRVMYEALVNLCGPNFIKKVEFCDKWCIGDREPLPQEDSIQLRIKARELLNDFQCL